MEHLKALKSPPLIDVACAILVNSKGQVLVAQRSAFMRHPLKMEFPGGKVEAGEVPEACLAREIKEELDLEIRILSKMPVVEHHYEDISVRMIPFICEGISGQITLREHAAYWWKEPEALAQMDWAQADVPIMKNYVSSLRDSS